MLVIFGVAFARCLMICMLQGNLGASRQADLFCRLSLCNSTRNVALGKLGVREYWINYWLIVMVSGAGGLSVSASRHDPRRLSELTSLRETIATTALFRHRL